MIDGDAGEQVKVKICCALNKDCKELAIEGDNEVASSDSREPVEPRRGWELWKNHRVLASSTRKLGRFGPKLTDN